MSPSPPSTSRRPARPPRRVPPPRLRQGCRFGSPRPRLHATGIPRFARHAGPPRGNGRGAALPARRQSQPLAAQCRSAALGEGRPGAPCRRRGRDRGRPERRRRLPGRQRRRRRLHQPVRPRGSRSGPGARGGRGRPTPQPDARGRRGGGQVFQGRGPGSAELRLGQSGRRRRVPARRGRLGGVRHPGPAGHRQAARQHAAVPQHPGLQGAGLHRAAHQHPAGRAVLRRRRGLKLDDRAGRGDPGFARPGPRGP
jgi:hypothetical protein